MKAKEIIWKEVSVLPHSANAYPKGKPYKGQMMMGRVFPVSKAQAMAFVEIGNELRGCKHRRETA